MFKSERHHALNHHFPAERSHPRMPRHRPVIIPTAPSLWQRIARAFYALRGAR